MPEYAPELEDLVRELNERVQARDEDGAAPAEELEHIAAEPTALDPLLREAVERGASDLILTAGSSLVLRVNGSLTRGGPPVYSGEQIRNLTLPLLNRTRFKELEQRRSVDFSFVRPGIGRFRTNIHFQQGTLGVTIRVLPGEIPSLESLNLPASIANLVERKKGLILMTGSAGSGKSSTLAALISLLNQKYPYHIVTIEDPIEYRYRNERSVIEQVEIGHDALSFAGALRSILRQSPDVILVGEIRDPETMAAALTAAETGHLVLSTMHTNDTVQSVGRILDAFPAERQNQIRQQLSLGLAAIIAQQLIPSADGQRRYPAVEILRGNTAVANLIRKGEEHLLASQLSLGRSAGMIMMEDSLGELVRRGLITRAAAEAHCFRPDELSRYLP